MDGFRGRYVTRNYTCDCGTRIQVSHIPERPLGDAKYEVYCPKCKKLLDDFFYTPGDPPQMEIL